MDYVEKRVAQEAAKTLTATEYVQQTAGQWM
jgi:hypothetical protein